MTHQIPRQRRRAAGVRSLAASMLFQAPGSSPDSFALVAPKVPTKKPPSAAEETLALHIRAAQLPVPVREFKFHPTRKWRLDFAWPDRKLAVEVEGLTPAGGRHQRISGYEADCIKYSTAALNGWTVIRVSGGMVKDGRALRLIEQAFNCKHRPSCSTIGEYSSNHEGVINGLGS